MGLDVGFSFYRKKEIKDNVVLLEPVSLKNLNINKELYNVEDHSVFVCGRCDSTYAFSNWVERHYSDCKENNKIYPEAVLNDETLNGFIKEDITVDYEKYDYSKAKLFYQTIDDLEKSLDFDAVQKEYNECIENYKEHIKAINLSIDKLREYQCKAETKAAFDGFQEQIDNYKEELFNEETWLKETEEEDYDYDHAKWLNDDIQEVKRIIKEYPGIIVTAWTSY